MLSRAIFILIFISFLGFSQSLENQLKSLTDLSNKAGGQKKEDFDIERARVELDDKEERPYRKADDRVFGFDFFENNSIDYYSPIINIPTSSDYAISYGDELEIIISGQNDEILYPVVSLNGSIFLESFGDVRVEGLNLDEANIAVNALLTKTKPGTKARVSVRQASLKKVNIIGAVKRPGTYLINPFSSIVEAISFASGPQENASLRKVQILRSSGELIDVDLYNFFISGASANLFSLRNGDTLKLNYSENLVKIHGSVQVPMYYEQNDDSLSEMINFAGGFKKFSVRDKVFVNYLDKNTIKTKLIKIEDPLPDVTLEIFVSSFPNSNNQSIIIEGSEVSNGYFEENSKYLSEVIEKLTFSNNIYPYLFTFSQRKLNGFEYEFHLASLADQSTYQEIEISSNGKLQFFSLNNIKDLNTLNSLGYFDDQSSIEELQELNLRKTLLEEKLSDNKNLPSNNLLTGQNNGIQEDFTEMNYASVDVDESKLQARSISDYEKILREEIEQINSEIKILQTKSFQELEAKLLSGMLDKEMYELLVSNSISVNYGSNEEILPLNGRFNPKSIANYLDQSQLDQNDKDIFYLSNGMSKKISDEQLVKFKRGDSLSVIDKSNQTLINVDLESELTQSGKYKIGPDTTLSEFYKFLGINSDNYKNSITSIKRKSLATKEELSYENTKKLILDAAFNEELKPSLAQSPVGGMSSLPSLFQLSDNIDFFGNLGGNFHPDSADSKALILLEGDEITIKTLPNTVSIMGQVNLPTTVTFSSSKNLYDYINLSGGFSKYADKKNIYILKANGLAIPFKRSYFSNGPEAQINKGDTIIVPTDIGRLEGLSLASSTTQLLSNLALTAASLAAINR